ncbi:MAG: hypothetical protein GXZ14_08195 [Ruminococcaceae bacterium]|nr:hypothetical protein [Oscillospiraceae bacterium]
MNILVLNGSPKGKNGITVQTAYYLQKRRADFVLLSCLHISCAVPIAAFYRANESK